jgi:hypothetical protein
VSSGGFIGGWSEKRKKDGKSREIRATKSPGLVGPGLKESRVVKIWLLDHAMSPRPGRRLIIIMPIIMARTLAVRRFIEWLWTEGVLKVRTKARTRSGGVGEAVK